MGKKQKEAVENAVTSVFKAAEEAIKGQATAKPKSPTIRSLEELKSHYTVVDLRIRKKDPRTGKFSHFISIDRQDPANLEEIGLEELCKDQGGGGEYQILIKDPDTRGWNNAIKFEGIHVSGWGYDVAKNDRIGASNPNPMGNQGQLPLTGYTSPPPPNPFVRDNNMKEMLKQQMDQSMGMNDRLMMIMNQSQQQQTQMMQAFMAMLVGNKNSSEDSEVRILKERLERMEQERKQDERFSMISKELAETKQQLALASAVPRNQESNKFSEIMLTLLAGQQNNQNAATNQYVELVKEMMNRPAEDEKISNLTGTMMRSMQGQMELISSAMRNGLLNSGGSDHPVAQIVSQALEGLTQVATVAFENRAAGGVQEGYDGPTLHTEVMPPFRQEEEQGQFGYTPPPPQLAEGTMPSQPPEPAQEEVELQAQELPQEEQVREEDILLSQEDLERISYDTALSKIMATIQNGVATTEVTARIYAHARSVNSIAIRWLQYPEPITRQILHHYGMEQHTERLVKNIIEFLMFMQNKGDPNEWATETGYRPIKVPPAGGKVTSVIPPSDHPEFGVRKGPAQQGEEYDSSMPPMKAPAPQVTTAEDQEDEEPAEQGTKTSAITPEAPLNVSETEQQPVYARQ